MKNMKTGFEPRKVGYVRLAKSAPPEKDQLSAIIDAGLAESAPIYLDQTPRQKSRSASGETLPDRAQLIRALQPGDVVFIANASVLGMSMADVLSALKAIGDAGAFVFDSEIGKEIRWSPETKDAIEFLQRAESRKAKAIGAKMRERRAELGLPVGGKPKLTGKNLALAKKLWADTSKSADEVAAAVGVGRRTLYRMQANGDLPPVRTSK